MSTVSLQMIVKDELHEVDALVHSAINYFDQINLTVSDKKTATALQKIAAATPQVHVKYRKWNDRFDDARNANLKMSTTDYFFWLDSDDSFDFTNIPKLVTLADIQGYDAIFLPYNYAQDDQGNTITLHWRERLIRRDAGFVWKGWIHETLVNESPYKMHKVDVEVKHNTTPEHAKASIARNHAILEKAFLETGDPRYAHYLGMSYFALGQYEACIEALSHHVEQSGSMEDTYRSLSVISEAAYHLGDHSQALEYATKCAILAPEYPMAYWLLAQYEADQDNWEQSLEWIKVSESKPDPETLAVQDPTARERAALIGAQAQFMLGHYNEAVAYLRKIPDNPNAQELLPDFLHEAENENFFTLLPKLEKFTTSPAALWNALTDELKYDTRSRDLRYRATEPKTWNNKSIVIFCGQGYEEWGPHTLEKGMGGSEEAVVYLSEELARLGYHVTVYGEYDSHNQTIVEWKHWKEIDTRDNFNIFVSWRQPAYLERITAKVKLADIHDALPRELIKDYPDVTYLFKTKYHQNLYAPVEAEVIGNGIKKGQFHD